MSDSPGVRALIEASLDQGLAAKGYTKSARPDFYIVYHITRSEQVQVSQYTDWGYGGGHSYRYGPRTLLPLAELPDQLRPSDPLHGRRADCRFRRRKDLDINLARDSFGDRLGARKATNKKSKKGFARCSKASRRVTREMRERGTRIVETGMGVGNADYRRDVPR
jgi:hypothetical protein